VENFAKDFRHHTDSAREENLLSSSGDITATRVVQKSLPERDSRKLPVRRAIRRKEAQGCRQSAAQLALQGAARSRCVTGRVQRTASLNSIFGSDRMSVPIKPIPSRPAADAMMRPPSQAFGSGMRSRQSWALRRRHPRGANGAVVAGAVLDSNGPSPPGALIRRPAQTFGRRSQAVRFYGRAWTGGIGHRGFCLRRGSSGGSLLRCQPAGTDGALCDVAGWASTTCPDVGSRWCSLVCPSSPRHLYSSFASRPLTESGAAIFHA